MPTRSCCAGRSACGGDSFRRHANGIEGTPLGRREPKDNSYGNSVTLPEDLETPRQADATLLALAESVAGRLRGDGKSARVVAVQLVDNAFRRTSHQISLPNPHQRHRGHLPDRPAANPPDVAQAPGASGGHYLASAPPPTPLSSWTCLPTPRRTDRQEKLDRAADALRSRFGDKAVVRARLLDPADKPTAPGALSAAKERDKRRDKGGK